MVGLPDHIMSDVTPEPCAYAVFEAQQGVLTDEEFAEKLSVAAQVLRDRLVEAGYSDAVVTVSDETHIRAEIPLRELGSEDDPEAVFQAASGRNVFEICDIYGNSAITGDQVEQAGAYIIINEDNTEEFAVRVVFNSEAAVKFAVMTEESAATGKPLDIMLDGDVISSPVANSEITGGEAYISGDASSSFTADEAKNLAIQIESGMLSIELTGVEYGTTDNS